MEAAVIQMRKVVIKQTPRDRWGRAAGVVHSTEAPKTPQGAWPRTGQFATTLMRAIISSTAWGTGTFSLSTRFMALAHTFSLFSTVNL